MEKSYEWREERLNKEFPVLGKDKENPQYQFNGVADFSFMRVAREPLVMEKTRR